jgi:hypothetical protein
VTFRPASARLSSRAGIPAPGKVRVAALDKQLETIDFLALLDLDTLPVPVRQRFFR